MDFRFVAHDPQTGAKLYQLPRANSVNIGDTFGTRGTLELTYSAKAVNARDLPTFLEVQAEVTFDQGDTWTPAGPSLLRLSGEHEDTDQAGMRTLRFVGREWVLGKARVGNGDLELIDGKRPFYRASPGQILRTLILEAQDRGAADGIEIGNFTASKDSSGKAWAKVATIYYSPGLPIGSVLENLVEQGMCDYRMDGRTLHLYDPETTMGRDLTTGDNPVRVHGAVTEAPVKYTLEDLANSALLMGDEGFELEVDNPTAPDDYGRLEVTIEQGGVSDSGTARLMVDEALHRGSREVREITRSQSAAGAAFLPFRDYRVGDYVQVHTGGDWERYRVREIQLARDGQEWTIHTVINDRLQELLLKLAKRTNGIVNGSKGSGGDGTRPTPPEKPGIEPAAPEGLVIDQQVYLDRQGIARGQITAGWGEVTESTKGQNVEIGGYELWWRRNETQETWTRVAVTDGSTSVNHSPVVLTDTFGNAMEYQWRVRAIAEASNRPGPWSDTVTLTMTQDTEPPNTPSTPTVTTDLRIVTVDVDGLDEFGEAMPVDFDHTRIYFAPAEDMVGAEQVGTLTQPGSWNSGSMTPDVPVWVAVSAVDNVGNESAMTPAQSVTPRKLVDDSSIRDELTGIDDKIQDAVDDLNEEIEKIITDGTGTTTYWMPTEPDETTTPPPKAGDLWFDTSEGGGKALSRHDGQGWVSASDERIQTIQDAQDALEADIDTVRTSVDGKSRITQSVDAPPTQYDGAVGDRWERMSSMGSGGQLISNWRWNGDVWVSTLLADAVIANLDAAKISTGFLDAARLEAGSVLASSIAVGDFTNLATIDPVRDINVTRPSNWATETVGDYIRTKETSQDVLMFKDRTDTVPFKAGDALRISFLAIANDYIRAEFRIWAYPQDAEGGSSGQRQISTSTFVFEEGGEQRVEATLDIPDDFGDGVVYRSCILGMAPHGTSSPMSNLGVRDVSVYRMTGRTLIQDGAITTDKIAVGAITADSGVVGSLDAGDITVGELEAARIGAKTITADKILSGTVTNLIPGVESWAESNAGWTEFGWNAGDGFLATTGENLLYTDEPFFVPGGEYMLEGRITSSGGTGRAYVGLYSEEWPDTGESGYRYGLTDFNGDASDVFVMPEGGAYCTLRIITGYQGSLGTSGTSWIYPISLRSRAGATLIQDGAITTDKILANAITAGKIAALAIEADHISANAITADKIHAGAIDSMLITGARIRTSASGARVELNSEGMKAYDASGGTVLSTDTADGSLDMRGYLRQTSGGITVEVGQNYASGGLGMQWSDSNIYNFPPGVVYGKDIDEPSKMTTLIQGPGVTGGNAYLKLMERGDEFDMRTWKDTGSSLEDWRVQASMADNFMRIGSSTSGAPYMRMERGSGGETRAHYNHPSNGGFASMVLEDRGIFLGTSDSNGKVVSRLWGDADSTELTAGSRPITIRGEDYAVLRGGRDSVGPWTQMRGVADRSMSGFSKVIVSPNGTMGAEGSSRRFKVNIESADADSYEDALLSISPKTWQDRIEATQHEEYLEWRKQVPEGPVPEDYANSPQDEPRKYFGAIAEDFEDAGLGQFVGYDEYGRPNALAYDRIGPALIPIIKRLRDRVDALETKLGETA